MELFKLGKHLDERGVTLQTVILISVFALAAVLMGTVLWIAFSQQESSIPGESVYRVSIPPPLEPS